MLVCIVSSVASPTMGAIILIVFVSGPLFCTSGMPQEVPVINYQVSRLPSVLVALYIWDVESHFWGWVVPNFRAVCKKSNLELRLLFVCSQRSLEFRVTSFEFVVTCWSICLRHLQEAQLAVGSALRAAARAAAARSGGS